MKDDETNEVNGFTASWVTQGSFTPPLVVMAVRAEGSSHEIIKNTGKFSLNVLKSDQKDLAAIFFKPQKALGGRFESVEFNLGEFENFIVTVHPKVPDHIDLDTENNIHVYLSSSITELANKEYLHIPELAFEIPVSELYIRTEQIYTIEEKGISVLQDNIFDVSQKSNIIIHIQLYF